MKLKTRLVMSFCIILFVPIVLALGAFAGLRYMQNMEFAKNYGDVESGNTLFYSSTQMMNHYTKEIYEELKGDLERAPDETLARDNLDQINERLKERYSYLVVRQNGEYIYIGDEDTDDVLNLLPEYDGKEDETDNGVYLGDDEIQICLKQIDYTTSDGSEGSVYIITRVSSILPETRRFLIDMIVSVVLILIFTGIMLIVLTYRGIVAPIHKLQEAVANIKDGNLNFTLEVESDDEIGQLCSDFEEMRQRLKENAEEKLLHDKESKELIRNISHDLKTPITSIKGYVEGLIDGVADTPQKQEKYLRTIYTKANEMDMLINELTLYSKIDTNQVPYSFQIIDVDEYFNDCIEDIGIDLEQKNIRLDYHNFCLPDTKIIADAEQLKRVINNIISNSTKYMDKSEGAIRMAIKDVGDFIQIEIEDNGKGIAREDLPYIFERFFRTDESRNSSTGGSGIGLSIVKKIVDDHGGKIWATSKVGFGTCMFIVIRKYEEANVYE
jgi:signal transduction histidine kinase